MKTMRKIIRKKYNYDLVSYEFTPTWTYIYTFRDRVTKETVTLHAEYLQYADDVLKNYLDRKEVK